MKRLTVSIEEAARALGLHPATAYRELARTGSLAGIKAIRASSRRVVLPLKALEELLGVSLDHTNGVNET